MIFQRSSFPQNRDPRTTNKVSKDLMTLEGKNPPILINYDCLEFIQIYKVSSIQHTSHLAKEVKVQRLRSGWCKTQMFGVNRLTTLSLKGAVRHCLTFIRMYGERSVLVEPFVVSVDLLRFEGDPTLLQDGNAMSCPSRCTSTILVFRIRKVPQSPGG